MAWRALVEIISDDEGYYHVIANTTGDSVKAAEDGAIFIKDILAEGKMAWLRVAPKAACGRRHPLEPYEIKGLTRFSFRNEPGTWNSTISRDDAMTIGQAKLRHNEGGTER